MVRGPGGPPKPGPGLCGPVLIVLAATRGNALRGPAETSRGPQRPAGIGPCAGAGNRAGPGGRQAGSKSPSRAPRTKARHSPGSKISDGLRPGGPYGPRTGPVGRSTGGQPVGGSEPTSHMEKNCEPPP